MPGSHDIARYTSLPTRTVPVLLDLFTIPIFLQSRTRAGNDGKRFIQFSENEIAELVDETNTRALLGAPLTPDEQFDLASVFVVSGANGPRQKLSHCARWRPSENMASVAAVLLDSTVLLMSTWILGATYRTSSVQRPKFCTADDTLRDLCRCKTRRHHCCGPGY
ncbi:hypothetical protein H4582DRAFT_235260 [Lactarius indigo]|nr:hypothetical protein H4582DRAFT_235260 [Lactarius indigo]